MGERFWKIFGSCVFAVYVGRMILRPSVILVPRGIILIVLLLPSRQIPSFDYSGLLLRTVPR